MILSLRRSRPQFVERAKARRPWWQKERGDFERHRPAGNCDAAYRRAVRKSGTRHDHPALFGPRLAIGSRTCAGFHQKIASTRRQMIRKKGARKRPFPNFDNAASAAILTRRSALGELERLARFGAAVLLALDHAGVAGEKTALFQNAA